MVHSKNSKIAAIEKATVFINQKQDAILERGHDLNSLGKKIIEMSDEEYLGYLQGIGMVLKNLGWEQEKAVSFTMQIVLFQIALEFEEEDQRDPAQT